MLNLQQQNIVQQNHQLIYHALHKTVYRSSELDDYYGYAAEGLCKAAKTYNSDKGAFSTYAVHLMQNEIRMEARREKRRTNDNNLWSLEQMECEDPVDERDCLSEIEEMYDFGWIFDDDEKKRKKMIFTYIIRKIEHIVSQREREMLKMLIDGKTQTEIGQAFQITQSQVSRNVKKLKTKVMNALREE